VVQDLPGLAWSTAWREVALGDLAKEGMEVQRDTFGMDREFLESV
jgi:hypothetical protein